MQERELLLQLFSEERARWKVEKEGWERSAEALISQRTKENPDAFKTEVSCSWMGIGYIANPVCV